MGYREHIPEWLRVSDRPRKGFAPDTPLGMQGLTAAEVDEIRAKLREPGVVKAELARRYDVGEHVIRRIARGDL